MKYIKEYLQDKLKISALGKITLEENTNDYLSGYDLIIDGTNTGIFIADCDYATYLEDKIETILSK